MAAAPMTMLSDDVIQDRAARGEVAFEDPIRQPVAYAPRPQMLLVADRRRTERGIPWPAVGMGMLAVTFVVLFVWLDGVALRDLGVAAGVAAAMGLSFALMRRGRQRVDLSEVPLLWLHTGLRVLRVRQSPTQQRLSEAPNVSFDEVREVLFALRQAPAQPGGPELESAAVFLRLVDGAVWPVIPSTLAKDDAYRIAVGVGQRVGVRVKQVGQGWSDSATRD